MIKRTKKPAVKPELRRQWLRRFEEEGQSPTQIAKVDGYDVRTVRKQIELTRQEREAREARSMVLRQALQQHYVDLCAFAQELDSHVSWPPRHVSLSMRENRMWQALKEHLPRSIVWRAIQRWEQLADRYDLCIRQVEERATVEAQARGLELAEATGEPGLALGFSESVAFDVDSLARGQNRLRHVAHFSHSGVTGTDFHQARMGAFILGLMHRDEMVNVEEVYLQLLDEMSGWEQTNKLQQLVSEFERQTQVLHDELAIITLRRIVPGRCRYCPL